VAFDKDEQQLRLYDGRLSNAQSTMIRAINEPHKLPTSAITRLLGVSKNERIAEVEASLGNRALIQPIACHPSLRRYYGERWVSFVFLQ
jgi:hypothetical protein